MRRVMGEANLFNPIFYTYPNLQDAVRVVLFNEKAPSEWDKVSDYLKAHKFITNENARLITHIGQRDKMSRLLKKWVSKGLLFKSVPKSGFVKGTKYRLPENENISGLLAQSKASTE